MTWCQTPSGCQIRHARRWHATRCGHVCTIRTQHLVRAINAPVEFSLRSSFNTSHLGDWCRTGAWEACALGAGYVVASRERCAGLVGSGDFPRAGVCNGRDCAKLAGKPSAAPESRCRRLHTRHWFPSRWIFNTASRRRLAAAHSRRSLREPPLASAEPRASATMPPAHQVADLAFHLGSRCAVLGFPLRGALACAIPLQQSFLDVNAHDTAVLGSGALSSKWAIGAVATKTRQRRYDLWPCSTESARERPADIAPSAHLDRS